MTLVLNVATALVVLLVVAVVVWLAILAATRATRLNRLNVRVDLARASLFAALDRRAVVARAIAAACPGEPRAGALADAASAAEVAERVDREAAENHLSTVLAQVDTTAPPPGLVAELADAQARVSIARRFYNDSVRDARTLGSRRMVRLLRLGGHAQLPEYFEISERVSLQNDGGG